MNIIELNVTKKNLNDEFDIIVHQLKCIEHEAYFEIRMIVLRSDWISWWNRMESEAEVSRKIEEKQAHIQEKLKADQVLVGWRGWWFRMELESKQDKAKQSHDKGCMKNRMKTNHQIKSSFIQKFYCGKNIEGEDGSRRMEKSQETL